MDDESTAVLQEQLERALTGETGGRAHGQEPLGFAADGRRTKFSRGTDCKTRMAREAAMPSPDAATAGPLSAATDGA